jgi:hypothetical protein
MKKFISAFVFVILLTFSFQASAASWTAALQAAINSGNIGQINSIAAANPGDQGAIALFLLQQAQAKLPTNASLAAKIFQAASPFVSQITGPDANTAANILQDIVNTAKESNFQQANCQGALTVLGAAINMSSLPNIVAANPNLHNITLAAANDSIHSNPQCDTKELEDQVSLAQQPFAPPTNTGPHIITQNQGDPPNPPHTGEQGGHNPSND